MESDQSFARFPAAFEQQDLRNPRDAVFDSQIRVIVCIQFADLDAARELSRDLIDGWGERTAGAAPGRPEVDERRLFALQDFLIPVRRAELANVFARHDKSLPFS